MYKSLVTIDVSTARKTLPTLLDRVFLNDETFIIAKRNIPVAKISKVETSGAGVSPKVKNIDWSLFGILKNERRNSIAVGKKLRSNLWRGI